MDVVGQAGSQGRGGGAFLDVDVLVRDGAPQPLRPRMANVQHDGRHLLLGRARGSLWVQPTAIWPAERPAMGHIGGY